ncbi:MAG: LysE family transporter [Prevotella sp.]|nr:LysE family transporter [Prevotella sp.]
MAFPFQIDILNIMVKGILIGVLASAPMGPVGILCIQRTLNKGRWYGLVTGVGASVSDIIYALITGFGMSFVMDLITEPQTLFYLKVFGSLLLMAFGIYCWRTDPTKKMHISGNRKGTLIHNGVTAFLVTFSNPLIIFLFMALFAQFTFVIPDHPFEMFLGYMSIVTGALIWWYGLTWLIDKIREKFDNNGILLINKIIGSLVIVLSIVILIGTIFNLYTFSY